MADMRSSSSMALALLPLLLAAAFIPSLASSAAEALDLDNGFLDGERLLMLGRFHGWMAAHGRSYATEEEKLRRFEVYRSNMEFIEAANRDGRMSYQLGETAFTDLTHDEFVAMYAGSDHTSRLVPEEEEEVITTLAGRVHEGGGGHGVVGNLTAVPPSVDWRAKGVVTPVKNQGSCRSCWAFTATATMESAQAISKGGAPPLLSEQQLVDCDTYNSGCSSGWMDKAYKWVIENGGVTSAAAYPYAGGKVGACQKGKPAVVKLTGYKMGKRNDQAALMDDVARQPVAVTFEAYLDPCLQHYIKGVYDAKCFKSGVYLGQACKNYANHYLALVGYGAKPDGTKYWIAKNSWSENWGEKGFIYILRDSSPNGVCGLAQLPAYPII